MTDQEPVGPSANRVGIGPLLGILAVLAVVTVSIIALLTSRSARIDVHTIAPFDVSRPSAGDGPFVVTLVVDPPNVVVHGVDFQVVGDGQAEAVVCEHPNVPPPAFGLHSLDDPVVQEACARVRPLDRPTATGPRWGRSLVLLVEATGPDDPTLCSMTLEAAVSDGVAPVTVADVSVGVAIRDHIRGNEVDDLRPFAGCPDVPSP